MDTRKSQLYSRERVSRIPATRPAYTCTVLEKEAWEHAFGYCTPSRLFPLPTEVGQHSVVAWYSGAGGPLGAVYDQRVEHSAELHDADRVLEGSALLTKTLAMPEEVLTVSKAFLIQEDGRIIERPLSQVRLEELSGEIQCCRAHYYGSESHAVKRGRADTFNVIVTGEALDVLGDCNLDVTASEMEGCAAFEYSVRDESLLNIQPSVGMCLAGVHRIEVLGKVCRCVCVAELSCMKAANYAVLRYFDADGRMIVQREFFRNSERDTDESRNIDDAKVVVNGQVLYHHSDAFTLDSRQ